MIKKIIIISLLLTISKISNAAPVPTAVNGEVIHGQNIVITGSGFGTKYPVAPLLWDPVDGMYTTITENLTVPTGSSYPWEASGGSDMYNPTFTLTNSRGKWTAKYSNKTRLTGDSVVLGEREWAAARANKLYVSWWMYPHQDPDNPGASNKLLRITEAGGYNGDFDSFIIDPGSGNVFLHSVSTGYAAIDYPSMYSVGQWNREEVLVDNVSSPRHPVTQYSYNGTLRSTLTPSANVGPLGGIFTIGADWSNAQNSPVPRLDWGEIYVDSTPARVEICSGSAWSSRGHCEIQIPNTTWSTSAVQVEVNQGSFDNGAIAFLYVVDSAGVAGRLTSTITFGAGNSSNVCYKDTDGDLYSDGTTESVETCSANYYESSSLTAASGDCNDNDASINPGETDIPDNGIDEDCSGADATSLEVIGECGINNGGTFSSLTSGAAGNCTEGIVSGFALVGSTYGWTCLGENGGANSDPCLANYVIATGGNSRFGSGSTIFAKSEGNVYVGGD